MRLFYFLNHFWFICVSDLSWQSNFLQKKFIFEVIVFFFVGTGYSFVDDGFASHGIIYKTSVLTLEAYGLEKIYEQDQWGQVQYKSFQTTFFLIHLFLKIIKYFVLFWSHSVVGKFDTFF